MVANHREERDMDAARMSRRQAQFRARIARAYSGWVHVALIFGLGAAAIAAVAAWVRLADL